MAPPPIDTAQLGEHAHRDETTEGPARRDRVLMTVGELARRTGLTPKAIRQYDALGLIRSAGRSESNYRLFDDAALWCVHVISTLRALGLTIKEIGEFGDAYCGDPDAPSGRLLAAFLDRAERRIDDRIANLEAVRGRIRDFRSEHAAALAGRIDADPLGEDPWRRRHAA